VTNTLKVGSSNKFKPGRFEMVDKRADLINLPQEILNITYFYHHSRTQLFTPVNR
jgi:hypothetical protein